MDAPLLVHGESLRQRLHTRVVPRARPRHPLERRGKTDLRLTAQANAPPPSASASPQHTPPPHTLPPESVEGPLLLMLLRELIERRHPRPRAAGRGQGHRRRRREGAQRQAEHGTRAPHSVHHGPEELVVSPRAPAGEGILGAAGAGDGGPPGDLCGGWVGARSRA
jgi:hypothetical protein